MALVDNGFGGVYHGLGERGSWGKSALHRGTSDVLRRNLRYPSCSAKWPVNDEEKNESCEKKFEIRVPSIPKFSDNEAARRLLESAFQALSFEMPKLPIESALQSFSFDVSRFSIPKHIFIFDLTEFVATKLRRPPTPAKPFPHSEEGKDTVLDEVQHPHCAWPRISKVAGSEQVSKLDQKFIQDRSKEAYVKVPSTTTQLHDLKPLSSFVERKTIVYPHCKWPREPIRTIRADSQLGGKHLQMWDDATPSVGEVYYPSSQAVASPDCALSRSTQQVTTHPKDALHPRSAWPRRGKSVPPSNGGNHVAVKPTSKAAKEYSVSHVVLYPRCAWPRRSTFGGAVFPPSNAISDPILEAQDSKHDDVTKSSKGKRQIRDCLSEGEGEIDKSSPAENNAAAVLPRRMLATTVGLTLMNQLARGGFIVTSPTDLFGLLHIAEDADAIPDLGRRTLVLYFRN